MNLANCFVLFKASNFICLLSTLNSGMLPLLLANIFTCQKVNHTAFSRSTSQQKSRELSLLGENFIPSLRSVVYFNNLMCILLIFHSYLFNLSILILSGMHIGFLLYFSHLFRSFLDYRFFIVRLFH